MIGMTAGLWQVHIYPLLCDHIVEAWRLQITSYLLRHSSATPLCVNCQLNFRDTAKVSDSNSTAELLKTPCVRYLHRSTVQTAEQCNFFSNFV